MHLLGRVARHDAFAAHVTQRMVCDGLARNPNAAHLTDLRRRRRAHAPARVHCTAISEPLRTSTREGAHAVVCTGSQPSSTDSLRPLCRSTSARRAVSENRCVAAGDTAATLASLRCFRLCSLLNLSRSAMGYHGVSSSSLPHPPSATLSKKTARTRSRLLDLVMMLPSPASARHRSSAWGLAARLG